MTLQTVQNREVVDGKLTRDEVEFYHKNGYVTIEGVLTPGEIAEMNSVVDEFIERSRDVSESNEVFYLEPGHTAEHPQVARIKSPYQFHEVFDRALRHDRVLDIVSQLIGDNIYYHSGKINIKPAKVGTGFEWHQDWAYLPHTNDDILAVGIALEDTLEENGCLMVVPGSHKGPIYDHTKDGFHVLSVSPVGLSERAVPLEIHAGGMSLHHVRTLHGSAPNASTRSRRLMVLQYVSGDAWPLTGGTDEMWEDLRSRTLRGQGLSVIPRMENLPVTLPFPKPRSTGGARSDIFGLQKAFG